TRRPARAAWESSAERAEHRGRFPGALEGGPFSLVRFIGGLGNLDQPYDVVVGRGPTRHDEIWLSRWKATTNRDRQPKDARRDRLPQKPKDDVPLGFVLGPLARTDSRTDRPYRGDDIFEVFKTRYLENLHGHLRESSIRRPASVILTVAISTMPTPSASS